MSMHMLSFPLEMDEWQPWRACSAECNGDHIRTREVLIKTSASSNCEPSVEKEGIFTPTTSFWIWNMHTHLQQLAFFSSSSSECNTEPEKCQRCEWSPWTLSSPCDCPEDMEDFDPYEYHYMHFKRKVIKPGVCCSTYLQQERFTKLVRHFFEERQNVCWLISFSNYLCHKSMNTITNGRLLNLV